VMMTGSVAHSNSATAASLGDEPHDGRIHPRLVMKALAPRSPKMCIVGAPGELCRARNDSDSFG
jgi:hypothetical protein